jgi:nitroreductase
MDVDSAIKNRRSIRKYKEQDVPEDMLQEVVETALWAPSGMNRQEWEIVVVRGEMRRRLLDVIAKSRDDVRPHLEKLFPEKIVKATLKVFENLGGAPVVILVYIPLEIVRFAENLDARGRYHLEFNRHGRLLSASALIQNLLLAAHARGLGTCWMTGPKYVEDEINELLGMQNKELVSVIPLGYPDQSPPAPPRKENVVHWMS